MRSWLTRLSNFADGSINPERGRGHECGRRIEAAELIHAGKVELSRVGASCLGIRKILEIDGGPGQALQYRPGQQDLGARKILADQAHLENVRLRSGPGNDGRQVLHLIGGDDRVVCLEVHRLGPP